MSTNAIVAAHNVSRVVAARRSHHSGCQVSCLQSSRFARRNNFLYVAGGNAIQQRLDVVERRTELSKCHVGDDQYERSVPHLIKKPGACLAELLLEAPAEHRRIRINTQWYLHTSSLSSVASGDARWGTARESCQTAPSRGRPACAGAPKFRSCSEAAASCIRLMNCGGVGWYIRR